MCVFKKKCSSIHHVKHWYVCRRVFTCLNNFRYQINSQHVTCMVVVHARKTQVQRRNYTHAFVSVFFVAYFIVHFVRVSVWASVCAFISFSLIRFDSISNTVLSGLFERINIMCVFFFFSAVQRTNIWHSNLIQFQVFVMHSNEPNVNVPIENGVT